MLEYESSMFNQLQSNYDDGFYLEEDDIWDSVVSYQYFCSDTIQS